MNILIIGAQGYLGGELSKKLSQNFNIHTFDIISNDKVLDLKYFEMNNIEAVINLANMGVKNNYLTQEVLNSNILLPQSICDLCKRSKFNPLLIHMSTREASGITFKKTDVNLEENRNVFIPKFVLDEKTLSTPANLFGHTKLIAEKIVLNYEKAIIFRLGTPYTSHLSNRIGGLISKIGYSSLKLGKVELSNGGKQLRDPLYIVDLAKLIELAIRKRTISGLFTVGGGANNFYSLHEIAKIINPKTSIIEVTGGDYGYCVDNSKVTQAFQWYPETNLNEIEWKLSN